MEKAVGIRRIINAYGYSLQGIRATYKHEAAFRQETWLFLVGAPLGLWLGETPVEQVLLIGSLLLVMIVEILNSAIESVVDRVGMEKHELSGRAKDQGSAAVLFSLLLAGITWGMILFT